MFDDRGYNSPTSLDQPIYHRTCGGVLVATEIYDGIVWNCMGVNCSRSWSNKNMLMWQKNGELGDRFFTKKTVVEGDDPVMVLKEEGGKAYHTLVPRSEAHLHKKAKLD